MSPGPLRQVLVKEFRALMPVWLAGAAAVWASTLVSSGLFALSYMAACTALGALSMGHEYVHRTLPFALSIPFARRRLLGVKLGVLAAMLGSLSLLMWIVRPWPAGASQNTIMPAAGLLLAAGCALFLSPVLTMLCRSTLGGMVFTLVIPALLLTGADLAAVARFGADEPAVSDAFKLRLFVGSLAAVFLAGALASPLMFVRLQAIEGTGGGLRRRPLEGQPDPAAWAPRRRSALWLLMGKELRLQAMTFVVAALHLLCWLGLSGLGYFERGRVLEATQLYCALLAVLAGALSSAEERQQGTLEWQLLLPMAAWRQWLIKAAVTVAVAILLAAAVPFMLLTGQVILPPWPWVLAVLAVTSVSIYVSSLVTGGVKAMVVGILAVVITLATWSWLSARGTHLLIWLTGAPPIPITRATFLPWVWWYQAVSTLVTAAIVTALLMFAFGNHRSLGRAGPRIARHAATVAGLMVLGVLALSALRFVRFGS